MSSLSTREEDISSLVAKYLLTVDVSLAKSFKQLTGAKPPEEHAPSLNDIYDHYKQCPMTRGIQRKRPAETDAASSSNHSAQNNNGEQKSKSPKPVNAEVIDLTSWSDPDSQELETPKKVRKILKKGPVEIKNEANSNLQTFTPQVPVDNILAPADIPQEKETNNNIRLALEDLPKSTTVKLEQYSNNYSTDDAESPVKIAQGIGCLCCNPQPGPSNWSGEEQQQQTTTNTPVQQKPALPVNLTTHEENIKVLKFSDLIEQRSTPQQITLQGVQVIPQMKLANPTLNSPNSSGDHQAEVTILQSFKDKVKKLMLIYYSGLDPNGYVLRNELRHLLIDLMEVIQKCISLKQELQNGIEQLNGPTQTEQIFQEQLKILKKLQTSNHVQSVSPKYISEIVMNAVKLLQTRIPRVVWLKIPQPNGRVTYLSEPQQANNTQKLARPEQTNNVQNLPGPTQAPIVQNLHRPVQIPNYKHNLLRPEQAPNVQNLLRPEQAQNVQNILRPEQAPNVRNLLRPEQKYNMRQKLLRQQMVYNLKRKTEPNAEKIQKNTATLHSVIKLLTPDEINQIATAQNKRQIQPQETAKRPRSQIRELLPQTPVIHEVAVPNPREVLPDPVEKQAEAAPVIETPMPKDHYQELLELEQQPLFPNLDAFPCPICLCDCEAGEGVMLHECLHSFCRDCLGNLIRHCDDAQVVCPYREGESLCGALLQEREMRALVSPEDYEKRLAKTVRLAENQMQDAFHCRTADCSGWCVHDANVTSFPCPLCGQTNCLVCKAVHPNETCAQYKQRIALEGEFEGKDGAKTKKSIEKMIRDGTAMHCPQCRVVVLKDKHSCDWVQCAICKCEICWVTRGPRWGPRGNGDNSGGCRCRIKGKKCHPNCKNCH